MSRTISLPDELVTQAEHWAAIERIPVEQFVSDRLSEQFAGLTYLRERAQRASSERFHAALSYVPDVEPEDYDQL